MGDCVSERNSTEENVKNSAEDEATSSFEDPEDSIT